MPRTATRRYLIAATALLTVAGVLPVVLSDAAQAVTAASVSASPDSQVVTTAQPAAITATLTPVDSNVSVYFQVSAGPNAEAAPTKCTPVNTSTPNGQYACADTFTQKAGFDNVLIFADLNGDGVLQASEPSTSVTVQVSAASVPATSITATGPSQPVNPDSLAPITGTVNPTAASVGIYLQDLTYGGQLRCSVSTSSGAFTCSDTLTGVSGTHHLRVYADNAQTFGGGHDTGYVQGDPVATVTLVVSGAAVPATAIAVTPQSQTVGAGNAGVITGTVTPAGATAPVYYQVQNGLNGSAQPSGAKSCPVSNGAFTCYDTDTAYAETDTVRVFADNKGDQSSDGGQYQDVTVTVSGASTPVTTVSPSVTSQAVYPGTGASIGVSLTPASSVGVYYVITKGPNATSDIVHGTPCARSNGTITCNDLRTASAGTDTVRIFADSLGNNGAFQDGDVFADTPVTVASGPYSVAVTPGSAATTQQTCTAPYTATVKDNAGGLVANAPLTLSASEDAGGLLGVGSKTGQVALCSPPVTGSAPSALNSKSTAVGYAFTGAAGSAQFTATSTMLGTANLSVSVGSGKSAPSAAATMTVTAGGQAAVQKLTASPATQSVGVGESVGVDVTVTDSSGVPVGGIAVAGQLVSGSASGSAAITCGATTNTGGSEPGRTTCSYPTGSKAGTDTLAFWSPASCSGGGSTPCDPQAGATVTVTAAPSTSFDPVSPTRVLDTRTGLGATKAPVGPGGTIVLTVPDLPAGTTGVVLNLTGTGLSGAATTYVSACPAAQAAAACADTSVLNVHRGVDVANELVIPVAADGKVQLYNNAGSVNLVADLVGYEGSGFTALSPSRVLDTRTGVGVAQGALAAKGTVTLTLKDVPDGATAVLLNVTGTHLSGAKNTYLSACPAALTASKCDATSVLNVVPGVDIANELAVPIAADGKVQLYNNAGSVDVAADLFGYLSTGYTSGGPYRVLDTRLTKTSIGPGSTTTLGLVNMPAGTTAVVLNVTETGLANAKTTYISACPSAQEAASCKQTSALNATPKVDIANEVVVPVAADGKVQFYNDQGHIALVVDLVGLYTAPTS